MGRRRRPKERRLAWHHPVASSTTMMGSYTRPVVESSYFFAFGHAHTVHSDALSWRRHYSAPSFAGRGGATPCIPRSLLLGFSQADKITTFLQQQKLRTHATASRAEWARAYRQLEEDRWMRPHAARPVVKPNALGTTAPSPPPSRQLHHWSFMLGSATPNCDDRVRPGIEGISLHCQQPLPLVRPA